MTKNSNEKLNAIPQMLTVKRVAEVLCLSERHVRRAIKDEKLLTCHFGGAIRISEEDLKAYIAAAR